MTDADAITQMSYFLLHTHAASRYLVAATSAQFYRPVKVKYTLEQVMRAQRGSRGIALLFFNLGARRGWVANATPRPLYPRKRPATSYTGGWVDPKAGLEGWKNLAPHRDSIPGPYSL